VNAVNAYSQYRQTAVQTSSPEKLLLMLYDGAIRFLGQAIKAIEEKDVAGRNTNLLKAQDIVREFMSTLNMDYEISNNLLGLYDFFLQRLIEANIKNDKEIIQEVQGWLIELRDTWTEASKAIKPVRDQSGQINIAAG